MKIRTPSEFTKVSGAMLLLYGNTGVGKTVSAILSCKGKRILLLHFESRPIDNTLMTLRELDPGIDKRLRIADYENWGDFMDYIYSNNKDIDKSHVIIPDNITDLMSTKLKSEIDEESWDVRKSDPKVASKALINQSKSGLEGMGAANNQMARMMHGLGRIAISGKTIICTGLQMDNPKYNLSLHAGPAFIGKQFYNNIGSWFTHIGKVESRKDDNGEILYPPEVEFVSPDNTFMCRWGGKPNSPKNYILDIDFILQN